MTDEFQQRIIEKQNGASLLLAGPGCGKTHILAQRIIYAHEHEGVPYSGMLCLTFTNRAAREMASRIEQSLGEKPYGLFVGNIHKFCLQFLFRNNLIPSDTNIIDEEDRAEYLADEFDLTSKADVKDFCNLCTYIYQTENCHPDPIRRRLNWTPSDGQIENARSYMQYKADNRLLDFDDIILAAYNALLSADSKSYAMTGYRWVQIDEVQDVTPLQLAVAQMVTAKSLRTMLFLGDEQQAIFAFLGAGGAILKQLKKLCAGNIMHLQRNYRSPEYLVSLTNRIAREWLDADPNLLPTAGRKPMNDDSLVYYSAKSVVDLQLLAASSARHLLNGNPAEDVAILTRTNDEALRMSRLLTAHKLEHFLVSQHDVFNSPAFKTVWAHLAVIANPDNAYSWTRILYQCRATKSLKAAREYAKALNASGLRPHELFSYLSEDKQTRLRRFVEAVDDDTRTIVVLDTETTGLDIFQDDVVQFAALKMRGGREVEGSRVDILIESGRPLPRTLGNGKRNPLCAVYETAAKTPPDEAYRMIAEYLADTDVIVGHNVEFDLAILRENFSRRSHISVPGLLFDLDNALDTLALARLIYPKLRRHNLEYLLDRFSIEGVNSHIASDDVEATAALLLFLTYGARKKLELQKQFFAGKNYMAVARKLCLNYCEFFRRGRRLLLTDSNCTDELVHEIKMAHSFFVAKGFVNSTDKFHYILRLISENVVDVRRTRNFREQLFEHLAELRTFSESDLFANGIVCERLSVMTIHKAKGLEMDNVVIYDASSDFGTCEERARVMYVAFSRPRKRLYVGSQAQPSEILASVLPHFRQMETSEKQALIMKERLNGNY